MNGLGLELLNQLAPVLHQLSSGDHQFVKSNAIDLIDYVCHRFEPLPGKLDGLEECRYLAIVKSHPCIALLYDTPELDRLQVIEQGLFVGQGVFNNLIHDNIGDGLVSLC
jgi:hypothetical protein